MMKLRQRADDFAFRLHHTSRIRGVIIELVTPTPMIVSECGNFSSGVTHTKKRFWIVDFYTNQKLFQQAEACLNLSEALAIFVIYIPQRSSNIRHFTNLSISNLLDTLILA